MAPEKTRIGAASRRSRPRVVSAVNRAGGWYRRIGGSFPRLDVDSVERAAHKAANLDDFGSGEFVEPLRVLLDSFESEARLNFFGRFSARAQVVTLLANRLQMQDWWQREPAILAEPISSPWFVVGLPRSGTTLMQQLLACDPAHRSLLFWEATNPAPPPERATYETDARITRAERSQRLLDYVAPEANAIHPVGARLPTECVSLLAHSFASLEFGAINHVPAHVRWCLEHDLTPHYEYFRRQLQLLQWRCGAARWTLKSPAHLIALDALLTTFPDARVIWMHREPLTAITSHCSLVTVLQRIGCDSVDVAAVGREWPLTWCDALDRALAVREQVGGDRFVDVHYDHWVTDPVTSMTRVYAQLGSRLEPQVERLMAEFLIAHQQHHRGVHRYAPADFSIDAQEVQQRTAAYCSRFDVPVSGV